MSRALSGDLLKNKIFNHEVRTLIPLTDHVRKQGAVQPGKWPHVCAEFSLHASRSSPSESQADAQKLKASSVSGMSEITRCNGKDQIFLWVKVKFIKTIIGICPSLFPLLFSALKILREPGTVKHTSSLCLEEAEEG